MTNKTIKINVPVLARVEGEGALDLEIHAGSITDLKLRIFEPPRYFEKFLEGRYYYDVPDTVARICGICPVAYQMSAAHAIESIFGITVTPWIRDMRRLFYCGEWLQSHSLHIHMLAAPDFLGLNSIIEMSADYGDEVRRGLRLQSLGNDLIALFGARSVHPVGACIGGFSKAPDAASIASLLKRCTDARADAIDLIHWVDSLKMPEDEQDFTSVALHHDEEYALNEGRLISDRGLDIAIHEFEQHFEEAHIEHSTALHCLLDGKPYLVGPLARLNLNAAQLPDEVKTLMSTLRTQFPSSNMFHSMMARALEILFAVIEAERLLRDYDAPKQAHMPVQPKAGTGYGCTEAPRGLLWHRYDMDDKGRVSKAVIVPPTSQNQSRIEQDLADSLMNFGLDSEPAQLQLHAEKVIRNYDPCISCATHFLDLRLVRDGERAYASDITHPVKTTLDSTAIIGIGSPNDGDDAGWHAIDQLALNDDIEDMRQQGLTLLKLDRPGITLIDSIEAYDRVLILDAVSPQQAEHSPVLIDARQIAVYAGQLSSHQQGLAEALALQQKLKPDAVDTTVLGIDTVDDNVIESVIDWCKDMQATRS